MRDAHILFPTISFFAASNEIPNFSDPQEKILEALYDRLELKLVIENISDREKRMTALQDKQTGRSSQIAAPITLDELLDMHQEVAAIPIPDAVNELADVDANWKLSFYGGRHAEGMQP